MEVTVNTASVALGHVLAHSLDRLGAVAETRAREAFGDTADEYDVTVEAIIYRPGGRPMPDLSKSEPTFEATARATKRPWYAPTAQGYDGSGQLLTGGILTIDTRTTWDDLNDRLTRIEGLVAKLAADE